MDKNIVYKNLLEKMLKDTLRVTKKTIVYVFYGFNKEFYSIASDFLLQNEIIHIPTSFQKKYIDIKEISNKEYKVKLNKTLNSLNNNAWMFYEEFISLVDTLNLSLLDVDFLIVKNNLYNEYYPLGIDCVNEEVLHIYQRENVGDETDSIVNYYSDCVLRNDMLWFSYVNKHYIEDTELKIEEYDFYPYGRETLSDMDTAVEINIQEFEEFKYRVECGNISDQNFYINDDSKKVLESIKVLSFISGYYRIKIWHVHESLEKVESNKFLEILKKYWGRDAEFRNNKFYKDPLISNETIVLSQGSLITDIINQCEKALNCNGIYSDIIITAPTGAGKSVLFQIPAIHLHDKKAITIVICPLIALMVDQVNELNEKGITFATFINSSISYEERLERLNGIKNGKYSLVYMSPELLLSYTLDSLIGEREIGLFVVDEAHLVTSWGRDFRADYWFLGDYLYKMRNSHNNYLQRRNFPVLCLTATAVYGGNDDVIFDLQDSLQLNCQTDHIYLGYVKRENIIFNIKHVKQNEHTDKEQKFELTFNEILNVIKKDIKTIFYFPFKRTIDEFCSTIEEKEPELSDKFVKYYGGEKLSSHEKDIVYNQFRNNDKKVMLSTKAFGMGVNISDIQEVYHFAPTGTLADYVQEIGRAARKLDVGYAVIDYLQSDLNYVKVLWGLSGVKQYQLRDMIKKLYEIYEKKKQRNLLITPDTFNYLFDDDEIESKVKSGLMLIKTDLFLKYHFKVLVVRPKTLFADQYVVIPSSIEKLFLKKYGKYVKLLDDVNETKGYSFYGEEQVVKKNGNVYIAHLSRMWEELFPNKSFAQFKHDFFSKNLFKFNEELIVPNLKVTIQYNSSFDSIKNSFNDITEALQYTFGFIRSEHGQSQFSLDEFYDTFIKNYKKKVKKENIHILLELFCYDKVYYKGNPPAWKFVTKNKQSTTYGKQTYSLRSFKSSYVKQRLNQYINGLKPNVKNDQMKYVKYVSLDEHANMPSHDYTRLVASILQVFNLAVYEINGGKNPEIFIRINDPIKLRNIAYSKYQYKNAVLSDISKRHKRAIDVLHNFMGKNFTNVERWNIIENYFLGREDIVNSELGIKEEYNNEINKESV